MTLETWKDKLTSVVLRPLLAGIRHRGPGHWGAAGVRHCSPGHWGAEGRFPGQLGGSHPQARLRLLLFLSQEGGAAGMENTTLAEMSICFMLMILFQVSISCIF